MIGIMTIKDNVFLFFKANMLPGLLIKAINEKGYSTALKIY